MEFFRFAQIFRAFLAHCQIVPPGAQILAGRNPVNIFGEPHEVRARIASIDAFSGHADMHELRRYVENIGGNLKKIAVVHGEESQCLAFAETLRKIRPAADVTVSVSGEIMEC